MIQLGNSYKAYYLGTPIKVKAISKLSEKFFSFLIEEVLVEDENYDLLNWFIDQKKHINFSTEDELTAA
jgi:hypothetical protein